MPELVHIDGKPFALIPLHEYRRLVTGDRPVPENIPADLLDKIVAGSDHPVKLLRKYRGMTQAGLAAASGLSRPYLTEIETGRKTGSVSALKALAAALGVDPGLLL